MRGWNERVGHTEEDELQATLLGAFEDDARGRFATSIKRLCGRLCPSYRVAADDIKDRMAEPLPSVAAGSRR